MAERLVATVDDGVDGSRKLRWNDLNVIMCGGMYLS